MPDHEYAINLKISTLVIAFGLIYFLSLFYVTVSNSVH